MKRMILYTLLIAGLLAGTSHAFPNFKLQGEVVNASHDSAAVSNASVILLSMKDGSHMPVEIGQTSANAQGFYTFPLADPDTAAAYFGAVDFMGVRYYSQGQDPLRQTIVVYDTTNSDQDISVVMHHLIIEDLGEALQIRETRIFNNDGVKSVSNFRSDDEVGEYTLRYALPHGAEGFSSMSSNLLIEKDGYIYDKNVIAPGTRQISYVYQIPYREKTAHIHLPFDFNTRSFDVFLKSMNLGLNSEQLQDHGPFTIRGSEYYRYGTADIGAGSEIVFEIVQQSAPTSHAEHQTATDPSPLPTILLTSVLLMAGLVAGHLRENGRTKK